MSKEKTQIFIVYYSMYGHIRTLANEIKKGVEKIDGVQATLWQVAETLSEEVLTKMHAAPKSDDPIITADDLKKADGIIFGLPTRYGNVAHQMKAFMDTTGGLWMAGALVGKTAGTFFSSGCLGGGQETTALTFLTHFAHHGMVYVPLGYIDQNMMDTKEVHGGSPYGAGTIAGPTGSRQPNAIELSLALTQGSHFAKITKALKLGNECLNKKG